MVVKFSTYLNRRVFIMSLFLKATFQILFYFNAAGVKGSIFLKNRHFIIQEKFNKLIYGINTIIKCGTWQPVNFQLASCSWNEMIFYHISQLMLPILIQRYNKKIISFLIQFKTERLTEILQAVRCHILLSYWYFIYQFIKPFLDKKKISIFEEYGAFKCHVEAVIHINLFITRFLITQFWIQHGSKMDPKNV